MQAGTTARGDAAAFYRQPAAFAIFMAARTASWAARCEGVLRNVAGGFASEVLDFEGQTRLSIALYGAGFRPRHGRPRLFDWERAWLRSRLPQPPARILVGGAGLGREALALVEGGYKVDAFDPAADLERVGGNAVRPEYRLLAGSYEQLAAAVLEGAKTPLEPFAHEQYDAVLLGWGSLSHLLDPAERERVFLTLDKLAPTGPILASFFLRATVTDSPGASRAAELGRRAARWIPRKKARSARMEGTAFVTWGGFVHHYTPSEIESLARLTNRLAVWQLDRGDPHVTFEPNGQEVGTRDPLSR